MTKPKLALRASVLLGFFCAAHGQCLLGQEGRNEPLTFAELLHRSPCELEPIYRQAKPGQIPSGFARGRVIFCPNEPFASAKSRMGELIWHGKHFCAADGTVVNQWSGVRAIRARVDLGQSWIDGRSSIILDYQGTSRVWNDMRDEMREVAPG